MIQKPNEDKPSATSGRGDICAPCPTMLAGFFERHVQVQQVPETPLGTHLQTPTR